MRTGPVIVRHLRVPITGLSASVAGLRIAHLSDLHLRRFNRVTHAAQDLLRTLEYDLLALTGDFAGAPARWAKAARLMREFLEPIAARAPVYAVLGNHDDPRLADEPDMPLTFLRNQSVLVGPGDAELELVGVEQSYRGGEDLAAALDNRRRSRPTILLAHYPSTVFRLPTGRVDLVLSGHTHGGQIRLPFLGCLWANDRISLRLARGLHEVGGTYLHVTAGIGVTTPIRLRVNCPPEIAVLTLVPAEPLPPDTRETRGAPVASHIKV